MIKISNLSKSFSGQTVLDHLDLDIQKGEVVALIGSSGAGKSTFLRSLNYLETPDSGSIQIDDFSVDFSKITQEEILALRRKLSMVFQQFNLFERRTALDNVKEGLVVVKKLSDQEATKIAKEELAKVGLSDRENHYPRHLSGGQKQRVALARALAMKPDVLVFDELTAGLDPYGREEMLSQIKSMQQKFNTTIVLVSHSMDDVSKTCDKVIVLNKGNIVLNDFVAKVFENGKMLESIGLDIPKCSKLFHILNENGYNFDTSIYTIDECVKVLDNVLNKC